MKIHLTSEQRIALKILHKNSRDSRVRDRIRCVLLAADGLTAAMIAQSQLIDETSVRRHLSDWLNDEKLKPENGCSDSYLSEAQTAELIAYLTDNLQPTTEAIIEWVDVQWGIGRFFIAVRETYPVSQKIHIILDGVGYHRAELVKEWAYLMNIDLHYLPPYSPSLNPIERIWKVMNEVVRNNSYFTSPKELWQEIHHFFSDKLRVLAGALSRRINDNVQTLGNASSS